MGCESPGSDLTRDSEQHQLGERTQILTCCLFCVAKTPGKTGCEQPDPFLH